MGSLGEGDCVVDDNYNVVEEIWREIRECLVAENVLGKEERDMCFEDAQCYRVYEGMVEFPGQR